MIPELVCDAIRESILTMKWFKRTAQGFQPWVRWFRRCALKVAPEVRRALWNQNDNMLNARFGRHFQGAPCASRNSGLKPWAVLSDHFMVKIWVDKTGQPTDPIPYRTRMIQTLLSPNNPKRRTIVNPNEIKCYQAVSYTRDSGFLLNEPCDRPSHGRTANEGAYGKASAE